MDDSMQLVIRRIEGAEEAHKCAQFMAHSEPWITLRRSYQDSLALMTDPGREVYVALVEGEIVGLVVLILHGAFVGYIQSVGTLPGWRDRGIGTRLLQFAEERIFREAPNVFICASSFNGRVRGLYERLGYHAVGELTDYIVPGHSEILMRKTLGPLTEFRPAGRQDIGAGQG